LNHLGFDAFSTTNVKKLGGVKSQLSFKADTVLLGGGLQKIFKADVKKTSKLTFNLAKWARFSCH